MCGGNEQAYTLMALTDPLKEHNYGYVAEERRHRWSQHGCYDV